MTIEQYIDNISKRYNSGNATEHTFRGDLQQLIESLVPAIRATNEPGEGTVSEAVVFLYKIVDEALKLKAPALILARNHPCGITERCFITRSYYSG